ncbi:hypothetical protein [Nocardia sp. NPDC050717]|uniref:hypothetical protein n=1 Tax=Nocardia sp. NPDC050717 TaxID=3157221 RepID=UPI0033CB02C8
MHGSQRILSRLDDLMYFRFAWDAQLAADFAGLHNAARGMRHYLGNRGDDMWINPTLVMQDVPSVKAHVDKVVTTAITRLANNPANHNKSMEFTSDWVDYAIPQDESQDWFLGMAAVEVSVTGIVTISQSNASQPHIAMQYMVHMFDRYNWDGDKSTVIAGVTVTDAQLGSLHTAGLAKEFNQFGSSTIYTFEGELPQEGSLNLPPSR